MYGEDCTAEMTRRATTIIVVGTPTITAFNMPNATPMVVSNITITGDGLSYAWQATGGTPGAHYYITFPLTLADGNFLNRTVIIPVQQYVG